jgi:molybdopterin synthase catalytic subunit
MGDRAARFSNPATLAGVMKVSVHYYAAARELVGCDSSTFEFATSSVPQKAFREAVSERFPPLAAFLERMRLAVNGDFVEPTRALEDGDRVDVLPPVAGGSPIAICAITGDPISLDRVRTAVEHPAAGGVAIFHGVVRNHADGKSVSRLEYEAHESLAEKEMRRVLEGVVAEHSDVTLAAVHRVGSLDVGDVAVCVAASAAHRDEAFTACRKAIDRIKETVPIWKKEWGADGEANWVNLEG